MGLRKLASEAYYSSKFDFLEMVNPPMAKLEMLKIDKTPKLLAFLPDPIYLIESYSKSPIDKLYYEDRFIIDDLRRFLDYLVDTQQQYLADLPQIENEESLKFMCLQRKTEHCLLFIVDKKKEVSWGKRRTRMRASKNE